MSHLHYVCGFLREKVTGEVIFVRKNKPAWQKGKLNGVGGKIESSETPLQAMAREFREEAGFEYHGEWRRFAVQADKDNPEVVVHFFAGEMEEFPGWPGDIPRRVNDIGEVIELHDPTQIPGRLDIISNLNWLLPLAFFDPKTTVEAVFQHAA